MEKAKLDWKNLAFGYHKTDYNIRYTWKDGKWGEGVITDDVTIPLHMAATCLHYGQEAFEGLKVFEQKDGRPVVFRVDENAKRLNRGAEKIFMAGVPEEMFIDAVFRVVKANAKYIPPYGTGATLYVRPLLIGTGPQIGVKPADEYMFIVLVTPVGPYFKTGFKPVHLIVESEFDRAAPNGTGDIKVGGNYAAGLRASLRANWRDLRAASPVTAQVFSTHTSACSGAATTRWPAWANCRPRLSISLVFRRQPRVSR